ncbi:MAG: protease complex subunit PrcB family protein [Lentisphaeria bacterium]|nr:protease complex subunit PrcB family protein [Lentisphaeria bacterium]
MKHVTRKTILTVMVMMSGVMVHGAREAPSGMPVEQEWKGFNAKQEKAQRLVIRDQVGWTSAWGEMMGNISPKPAVPPVDFAKHMVIAVFMGRRNTGGHAVKIVNVEETDKVIVTIRESSPAEGDLVTMALTSPYHVIVIPKSDKNVEFVNEKMPADNAEKE